MVVHVVSEQVPLRFGYVCKPVNWLSNNNWLFMYPEPNFICFDTANLNEKYNWYQRDCCSSHLTVFKPISTVQEHGPGSHTRMYTDVVSLFVAA